MPEMLLTVVRTLISALRGYRHLVAENLALRQQLAAGAKSRVHEVRTRRVRGQDDPRQLATFKAKGVRPRIRTVDRAFWIAVRELWSRWADLFNIVRPETVVRWHRKGFVNSRY